MYIETGRLIIRTFEERDAEALYNIKSDKQVLKYIPDFLKCNAQPDEMLSYIREFVRIENEDDTDTWRCYAIENKNTGEVIGSLSFEKHGMLHEYKLGWQVIGEFTGNGFASEAAQVFAEYFCERYNADYITAVMDVDNPASFRVAEKSGFGLFEKRTVYDRSYNGFGDDYYYFRRYYSKCSLSEKFYGDIPFDGRSLNDSDK